MTFDINTFKQTGMKYGGARPSAFAIDFAPPAVLLTSSGTATTVTPTSSGGGVTVSAMSRVTCKAATIPEDAVSHIDVGYFGRKIKVSGVRSFANWEVTVYNDESFVVRAILEAWSNAINRLESNVMDPSFYIEAYKANMMVHQYSKTGTEIRAYSLVGAWPSVVSQIRLDWDDGNRIETFDVNIAYDYWLPELEGSIGGAPSYATSAADPGNSTSG